MVNVVPENWNYSDELEMLFLFYQCTDELLSKSSTDTYALPLHNSITLIEEIIETFSLLNQYNIVKDYYEKYIPVIIDEFINSTTEDFVLKRLLGDRLDSIITGLKEAKQTPSVLNKWINIFKQSCDRTRYRNEYANEIIRLVCETKEKKRLIYCMKNYYVYLISVGYSREYIYTCSKRFFHNNSKCIDNKVAIRQFLANFSCTKKEYDFLILMDIDNIDYLDSISENIKISQDIHKVDVLVERAKLCEDQAVCALFEEYDKCKQNAKEHQKIAIVEVRTIDFDPYKSALEFCDAMFYLQTFKRYFIHHNSSRQVYSILVKRENGTYWKINLPNRVRKRPYVAQDLMDKRVKNIITSKSLGRSAFLSLTLALEMHASAFDSKNTINIFRSLWSALEALFLNPNSSSTRDNVINSTLNIIQKTYILKLLRGVYSQINDAIDKNELTKLGVNDFKSFVCYFANYSEDSTEMKRLYSFLANNPLLRMRLYQIRHSLRDGNHIQSFLNEHKDRVHWQICRLQRIRNIATHLGTETVGAEYAVNNLHSYFDYIVNYMLCKSENGNYIVDVSTLVFEAKNDIRIYEELLKENQKLSIDNYNLYLFGPDPNMIMYKFEY